MQAIPFEKPSIGFLARHLVGTKSRARGNPLPKRQGISGFEKGDRLAVFIIKKQLSN